MHKKIPFFAVLALIADLVLSGWQIGLFSTEWEGVPSFFADYSVYFVKKLLLAAVELVIYLIAVGKFRINILNEDWDKELYFWISVLEMAVGAIVVLVIGSVRAAFHRK